MSEFLAVYSATLQFVMKLVPTYFGVFLALMTLALGAVTVWCVLVGVFALVSATFSRRKW